MKTIFAMLVLEYPVFGYVKRGMKKISGPGAADLQATVHCRV